MPRVTSEPAIIVTWPLHRVDTGRSSSQSDAGIVGENDVSALPTVLFVATPPTLGGSNRSLVTILRELEGRVERVVAAPPKGTFAELVRREGLADEYVELPRRPRRPIDRPLRLFGGIRIGWWAFRNRRRLSAIHANALTGLNLSVIGSIASRRPTVVWIHDPVGSRWGERLGPILRRLLPGLRIAAVSETAESVAVANGLCSAGDATIIPNPIDPAEIRSNAPRIDRTPLHVGFVGAATNRKGFDLLPALVRSTIDLPILWKLYVWLEPTSGSAHVWDELAEFDSDRVLPVGNVPDVRKLYGDLDIVFIPSRAESFCRVAAEAMLNGLPVLGSDIDPLIALLGDDEAGLIFPSEDVAAAEIRLRRLVADADLRTALGLAGEERAARFAPAQITEQLMAMYRL